MVTGIEMVVTQLGRQVVAGQPERRLQKTH